LIDASVGGSFNLADTRIRLARWPSP
jgi:hypothetical protein